MLKVTSCVPEQNFYFRGRSSVLVIAHSFTEKCLSFLVLFFRYTHGSYLIQNYLPMLKTGMLKKKNQHKISNNWQHTEDDLLALPVLRPSRSDPTVTHKQNYTPSRRTWLILLKAFGKGQPWPGWAVRAVVMDITPGFDSPAFWNLYTGVRLFVHFASEINH